MISQAHCQQCGSTDGEDVGFEAARNNDGYSACCNELIMWECNERDCSHD